MTEKLAPARHGQQRTAAGACPGKYEDSEELDWLEQPNLGVDLAARLARLPRCEAFYKRSQRRQVFTA